MKKIRFILVIAAIIMCFPLLVSCGNRYDIDEIREITKDLVERSAEFNVIYFGEGLPVIDAEDKIEEFYETFGNGVKTVNYLPVLEDCPYQNEAELREATLEVFTENYCEVLFKRAFEGLSYTVENYEDPELDENVNIVYAMYIEKNGILTVRLDLDEEAMKLGRVYDYENLRIVREHTNYVIVEIPTEFEGKSLDVELKIIKTENGWRLDTPTY